MVIEMVNSLNPTLQFHYILENVYAQETIQKQLTHWNLSPLLPTWFNFNPSMHK